MITTSDANSPIATQTAVEDFACDASLVEEVRRTLYREHCAAGELERDLERLAERHGDVVYSRLIQLLSRQEFEPTEARRHWSSIRLHREQMERKLMAPVALPVALVSYFVEELRNIRTPMVIELQLFEQTRASAMSDELTGLSNFRAFGQALDEELLRSDRTPAPVSLVLIDLDHFKHYNDKNGHLAGNHLLAEVARVLTDAARTLDVVARYGGEEFCLILPMTPKTDAFAVAERVRSAIEQHGFDHADGQPGGRLTASVGVATYPGDAKDAADLVRCADRAMYEAKASGRNRVQLYGRSSRSFRRVRTSVEGSFRHLTVEGHALTALSVSEGGMLFRSRVALEENTLIELKLPLSEREPPLSAVCRVIRQSRTHSGQYETAVRVLSVDALERLRLSQYLETIVE